MAGIFILFWLLFKIKAIFLYIGLAVVVSLLGRPIMIFFKKRMRLNNVVSAFLTLFIFLGFISLLARILIPVIINHGKHFTQIDFEQVKRDLIELNRSEEHTSELQSRPHLVCRLLLEKK